MARMYVSLEKLQRAAQLIDALADLDQPGKLPEIVLPGVADLVGCDVVTYNEIASAPGQAGYYLDYPHGCINPVSLVAFEAHLQEHPLLIHYGAGGAGERAKISDFLSQQRFHRLGLYSEFFRHIPVEYQIAFSLPDNQDGRLTAIALNRAGRDFSEDDRGGLKALSTPLGNAMRRARDRHSAGAALGTAGSDGLADLTDREITVLGRPGARPHQPCHRPHLRRQPAHRRQAPRAHLPQTRRHQPRGGRLPYDGHGASIRDVTARQAVRRPIARAAGYSRVVSWRSTGTSLKAL